MRSIIRTLYKSLIAIIFLSHATVYASTEQLQLAESLCSNPQAPHPQLEDYTSSQNEIVIRGVPIGTEYNYQSDSQLLEFERFEPVGRPPRSALTITTKEGNKPDIRVVLSNDCNIIEIKRITYDGDTALFIETLDESLQPVSEKEWLNPPLPNNTGRKTGLRVALIDSGVNYTLPRIADSLALDTEGNLIGYDFWDNDTTPYDSNPARSPFFVQRHGTRTASILIDEAPGIALVPYRYPRPDMSRMTQLIEHAAKHFIRIIGMPLGSRNYKDWVAFGEAVEANPQILFIVSAGNNGRDIDINPIYPAALEHSNILVVTSSDDYIRPAERTNYGKISVDYLLPAEEITASDYDGSDVKVSGSSYAVSRMAALAARQLTQAPDMTVEELKEKIAAHSIKASTGRWVKLGYIGDPLADTTKLVFSTDNSLKTAAQTTEHTLAINLVALEPGWTNERIKQALATASSIYAQCELHLTVSVLLRIEDAGHLARQTPGNALQLHRQLQTSLQPDKPTIYLASDTDMQEKFDAEAFGLANTSSRPWMTNSVWVTVDTKDTGHALAHELFHVMANQGNHSTAANNLMHARTAVDNIELTPEQCQLAITTATSNGMIEK